MDYSARLKRIAEQIKAILKKEDIAGLVVLHTPGYSEYFLHLTPSYSCLKVSGGQVRIQSRLLQDYNGDRIQKQKKDADTANMLNVIGVTAGNVTMSIMDLSELVDQVTGAEHTGGTHRPDNYQDN